MKAYIKNKMTFQEYSGNRWWKQIRTYLKNQGINVTKKHAKKVV